MILFKFIKAISIIVFIQIFLHLNAFSQDTITTAPLNKINKTYTNKFSFYWGYKYILVEKKPLFSEGTQIFAGNTKRRMLAFLVFIFCLYHNRIASFQILDC